MASLGVLCDLFKSGGRLGWLSMQDIGLPHAVSTLLFIGQRGHAQTNIPSLSINQPYKRMHSCGGPV